jgi:hypothetical protein
MDHGQHDIGGMYNMLHIPIWAIIDPRLYIRRKTTSQFVFNEVLLGVDFNQASIDLSASSNKNRHTRP